MSCDWNGSCGVENNVLTRNRVILTSTGAPAYAHSVSHLQEIAKEWFFHGTCELQAAHDKRVVDVGQRMLHSYRDICMEVNLRMIVINLERSQSKDTSPTFARFDSIRVPTLFYQMILAALGRSGFTDVTKVAADRDPVVSLVWEKEEENLPRKPSFCPPSWTAFGDHAILNKTRFNTVGVTGNFIANFMTKRPCPRFWLAPSRYRKSTDARSLREPLRNTNTRTQFSVFCSLNDNRWRQNCSKLCRELNSLRSLLALAVLNIIWRHMLSIRVQAIVNCMWFVNYFYSTKVSLALSLVV